MDDLYQRCLHQAELLINKGYPVGDVSVSELADTMYKLEVEKNEKNARSDANIDYDDEIVEIEELEEIDTVDISVSGDNLFYCNNILTKNSFGLPATADLMIAIISNDQLAELGQYMVKQLKNRYNDVNMNKKFVIGVDKSKMRLYNLESSAQNGIIGGSVTPSPTFKGGSSDRGDRFGSLIV